MATKQTITNNGGVNYTITDFDFLAPGDLRVKANSALQTLNSDFTLNGKVITFASAPTTDVEVIRITEVANPIAEFQVGSSIRAQDLNNATNQVRFAVEELQTVGADGIGLPLTAGDKVDITVNNVLSWSINDNKVTTAKLQNSTSTTTGVTTAKIADEAITTAKINANAVTMDKLGAGALPSDISVGASQLTGTIPNASFPSVLPAVDGNNLTGIEATVGSGCVYENNQTITSNYTVGSNKNALSAGPITINNGIVVTIGSTESYTIV